MGNDSLVFKLEDEKVKSVVINRTIEGKSKPFKANMFTIEQDQLKRRVKFSIKIEKSKK